MKKRLINLSTAVCLLFAPMIYAQQEGKVGINTESPAATLEVKPYSTEPSTAEGIIIPKLTYAQLKAKNSAYADSDDQVGTLIFVTDVNGYDSSDAKTTEVNRPGYYIYERNPNGTEPPYLWRNVKTEVDGVEVSKIVYTSTTPLDDKTVKALDLEFRIHLDGSVWRPQVRFRDDIATLTGNRRLDYGYNKQMASNRFYYLNGGITFSPRDMTTWKNLDPSNSTYPLTTGSLILVHMVDSANEVYYRVTFFSANSSDSATDNDYAIVVEKY